MAVTGKQHPSILDLQSKSKAALFNIFFKIFTDCSSKKLHFVG